MASEEIDVSFHDYLPGRRAFVLVGGINHDGLERIDPVLDSLENAGLSCVVSESSDALADLQHDLLVVDALWWTMGEDRYDAVRDQWAREISDAARAAVERHVADGSPILALHTAVICFDDWPRWGELVGGAWNWERSSHPPLSDTPVHVDVDPSHPLAQGRSSFDVIDEVYGFLDLTDDIEVAATSAHGGENHPVMWSRTLPSGSRVVVDTLGHDARSWSVPEHAALLDRSVKWLVDGSGKPL